jgi:hypothetical protein
MSPRYGLSRCSGRLCVMALPSEHEGKASMAVLMVISDQDALYSVHPVCPQSSGLVLPLRNLIDQLGDLCHVAGLVKNGVSAIA